MSSPRDGRFRIDQTLHGYRQGHRWLAGSIRLEGAAEATLLGLSDLLTSDLAPGQDSYLSGYPLKNANRYVLTRTWLAPETPRPGSVWSHSLILDYAALGLIDDLSILLSLFRRPESVADLQYAEPIPAAKLSGGGLHPAEIDNSLNAQERADVVLRALYGRKATKSLSMPAGNPAADEALAVVAWRQMWPALRRDFAFFTRVRGEVAEISANFSLYFRTDELHGVSPAPPATKEAAPYVALFADLQKSGPTELRRYLGRYALDAPEPRRIVPELVMMHARRNEPGEVALDLAGRHAGAMALPRLKRDILLQAIHSEDASVVAQVVGALRNEPLSVSAEELDHLVSTSVGQDRGAVSRVLEAASPSEDGQLGDVVLRAIAAQASVSDLAHTPVDLVTRRKLLSLRPALAAETTFWPASLADRAVLMPDALACIDRPEVLIAALGSRLTPREAQLILNRYGLASEHALFDAMRGLLPDRDAWSVIQGLLRRPGFLQREAEQRRGIGIPLLDAAVGDLLPEVSLQPGSWLALARRELGQAPLTGQAPNLATGALTAALAAPMPDGARLLELSFDAVYEGLNAWSFPGRLRDLLESQLGRRSKEWRLVDKLVAAIVDKYGGPDGADPWLLMVTRRDDALREIVDRIARKGSKGALEALAARAKAQRRQELAPRIQYLSAEIARRDARWTW